MNPPSKMSAKKVRANPSSTPLTKKLLGDHGEEQQEHQQRDGGSGCSSAADEAGSSSPLAAPGESREEASLGGGLVRRRSSVESILRDIAKGSTVASTPWKLTRAVVHLEDAWKGRVYPCPPLDKKEPAAQALFKLRWRYRSVEFWIVHLLLCKCTFCC